ncbi:hypothetical protein AAFF_G00390090 [Aldrovandia affinis]|uniref:Taste receptor type 2 n=1 Tax=Aldrovandia affinis TaxID=143900 RepID=A0AAD7WL98_9TELE|nr:hypothetical protein AAFF_G00390090 [Aldrovandia affinis]
MFIWLLTGLIGVFTIFFNLYILLMSLRTYRQNGHWIPSETIIAALTLVNGAHQVVSYLFLTLDKMDTQCIVSEHLISTLLVVIYSLKFCIMWTTAFLTFYYSTKLVIEPIHCYTKVQEAILKHVTTVVLLIALCAFGSCLPMIVVLTNQRAEGDAYDCGTLRPKGFPGLVYMGYYLLMSDIVPGLLMAKCSISISVHLAIHLRHMKASANGFHGPKLGSEMRVIRMNLGLVAIFILFLVVDLYVHYMNVVENKNAMPLTVLFTSFYTAVSTLVLIYGRKTFCKELLLQFRLVLGAYARACPCLKDPEDQPAVSAAPGH